MSIFRKTTFFENQDVYFLKNYTLILPTCDVYFSIRHGGIFCKMIRSLIYRSVQLIYGTLYPAYRTYKVIETRNGRQYSRWIMYWIVFALFVSSETFLDIFLFWIPFYNEIKILCLIWLQSPCTKGATMIYKKFIHSTLRRYEIQIDRYFQNVKDQICSTLYRLGRLGFSMVGNIISNVQNQPFEATNAAVIFNAANHLLSSVNPSQARSNEDDQRIREQLNYFDHELDDMPLSLRIKRRKTIKQEPNVQDTITSPIQDDLNLLRRSNRISKKVK